jgi:small subunit ribosomal protein S5
VAKAKISDSELKDTFVHIARTAKVVKGGRRFSFSAIVVVGDGQGNVGVGLGKAKEVTSAITKATEAAKKSVVHVKLRGATIPHESYGIFGAGKILLKPASPGTGVIAGRGARGVLEAAGVQDILAKSQGSSNPHNVVKATLAALSNLEDAGSVASRRGIDLAQVFNG